MTNALADETFGKEYNITGSLSSVGLPLNTKILEELKEETNNNLYKRVENELTGALTK